MSSEMQDILIEMAASELDGMNKSSAEFAEKFQNDRKPVEDSFAQILGQLAGRKRKEPQLNPQAEQIARVLTGFPQLIPVVQGVIDDFVAATEKASADLAKKYAGMRTPEAPPAQGGPA